MSGAFRSYHAYIYICRRHNLGVVDIEAMGKHQGLAPGQFFLN